jgi:DNA ligase D-like protein (predicted ligase)
MKESLARLTKSERECLRQVDDVAFIAPMLATLTHEPFSSEDWIYERKLDGERIEAIAEEGRISLFTRNRNEVGDTYPEITEALACNGGSFTLDGEVVAFDGKRTSFSRLQSRMHASKPDDKDLKDVSVFYYVFDIMRLGRCDLRRLPLRARKSLLKSAIRFEGPVRFCPHRNGDGEAWLKEACTKGWEGLIAKRSTSTYVSKRSRDWLKFKCSHGQEFVIVGYTEPDGSRIGFGSLLLGYYDDDRLRYAGRVGTGFDDAFLDRFSAQLTKVEQENSPLLDPPNEADVHWVRPTFVGEVAFTEWTKAGKLRHPRFLGLRRDKPAEDVVREDKG